MKVTIDLTDEQVIDLMRQAISGRSEPAAPHMIHAHIPHSDAPEPCDLEGCQRLGADRRLCLRAACPHSESNAEARTGVAQ